MQQQIINEILTDLINLHKLHYKHMYINNRIEMITYQNINVKSDPI